MIELLITVKKRFEGIPDYVLQDFTNAFYPEKIEKGTELSTSVHLKQKLLYMKKGAIIGYVLNDAKRHIVRFCLEGSFMGDYKWMISQEPLPFLFKAIEDSEVYVAKFEDIQKLYSKNDFWYERLGRVISEQQYVYWLERCISLLTQEPGDRYKKLIEQEPTLAQRVPQYLIAEYLGVTAVGLSRIKKRLLQE